MYCLVFHWMSSLCWGSGPVWFWSQHQQYACSAGRKVPYSTFMTLSDFGINILPTLGSLVSEPLLVSCGLMCANNITQRNAGRVRFAAVEQLKGGESTLSPKWVGKGYWRQLIWWQCSHWHCYLVAISRKDILYFLIASLQCWHQQFLSVNDLTINGGRHTGKKLPRRLRKYNTTNLAS